MEQLATLVEHDDIFYYYLIINILEEKNLILSPKRYTFTFT